MPALFTSTSVGPWMSKTVFAKRRQFSSFVTSSARNSAWPFCALSLSVVSRPLFSSQSVTNTNAPARANVSAIAAPMPEPAPVTRAILFWRLNISLAANDSNESGFHFQSYRIEIRMSKSECRRKPKCRSPKPVPDRSVRIWSFAIPSSFVIRISDLIRRWSWDLQQLRLAPRFLAFLGLCADGFHRAGFNRTGRMSPFATDVSQNRSNLLIVENGERRHVELKGLAFDVDGAVQAVQHDAHESLRRAQDPVRIHEWRRQPLLAHAVRLMAGAATDQVKLFALVEPLLLLRRKRFHGDFWFRARLPRPR